MLFPRFAYLANPDNSREYDFTFDWQKTITADLAFSIGDTFTHLTNTVKPNGTIGTLNGWGNIETQLEYQLYVNPEHEFIVSTAVSVEWGHTGDVGIGFADPFTSITAKGFRRQGLWRCGGRVGEAHRGHRRNRLHLVNPPDRRDGSGPIRQRSD